MPNSKPSESPLEAAAGAAGPHATEAFAVLGHETRLAILLALWEAYEPFEAENTVSFGTLRKRVGMRDGSQFNYHLKQLVGRFVRQTDDGYELRRAGRILVQSIIAGTGIEEPSLDLTEIDAPCPRCGAPTAITYENVYVYHVCTECHGWGEAGDEHPPGSLSAWTFEPTGLSNRTAAEAFVASTIKNFARIAMRFEGICPVCSGPVEWSLEICDDHETATDGSCPTCGRPDAIHVRETCTVCKSSGRGSPGIKVLFHPAVVAFYYNRGVEIGFTGNTDLTDIIQILNLIEEFQEEVVSTDPPRIRITTRQDGDELHLLLDGGMNVISVNEET